MLGRVSFALFSLFSSIYALCLSSLYIPLCLAALTVYPSPRTRTIMNSKQGKGKEAPGTSCRAFASFPLFSSFSSTFNTHHITQPSLPSLANLQLFPLAFSRSPRLNACGSTSHPTAAPQTEETAGLHLLPFLLHHSRLASLSTLARLLGLLALRGA